MKRFNAFCVMAEEQVMEKTTNRGLQSTIALSKDELHACTTGGSPKFDDIYLI